MTVECVDCERFNLRIYPAMAAHGFGACEIKPVGVFMPADNPHDCERFAKAEPKTITARREWLKKRDARRNK